MATKAQLIERWEEETGKKIAKQLDEYFEQDGKYPEHLEVILKDLPYREEVPEGKDLRAASLGPSRELNLQGYDFSYASIEALYQCKLNHARFDFVRGARHLTGILDNGSFRKVRFRKCYLFSSSIQNACFDEADLMQARFTHSDLSGSSFRNAKCKETSFYKANLMGCDFRGADLTHAFFSGAIIDKTTDFRGANLTNACFEEDRNYAGDLLATATDWRQATYDETTIFGDVPLLVDLEDIKDIRYMLTDTDLESHPLAATLNLRLIQLEEDLKQNYRPNALFEEFFPKLPQKEQELLLEAFEECERYRAEREP